MPGAEAYELRASVTPLQRMVAATPAGEADASAAVLVDATPLRVPQASYWTTGKVALWGGLLAASLLAWAWEAVLEDRWEAWRLRRRMRQRREGKRSFTMQENLDDIIQLLLAKGVQDMQAAAEVEQDQELGWRRMDAPGAAQQQRQQQQQQQQQQQRNQEAADAVVDATAEDVLPGDTAAGAQRRPSPSQQDV